ncbi:hypothetical protein PR202_gb03539 [Eleusine coracana subsp. coracana]|uniref:Uncharacterized protein n=1 Tax=Eleusine coracana subsp. coracana TaxID=191504 RepID=A0AAV5E222_ELECO|nr:hypothetical protein PR202_gb03539 [Eleusine coracana subsp. coracana]
MAGWRGKLLSYAARVELIKSCLASIPVYLMSFIKLPKWAIEILNSHMAHCLWNNTENQHKYHLAHWKLVRMRKEYGGFGILDLRDLNICLLGSWLKRYQVDNDKIWKQVVDHKYKTSQPNVFCSNAQVSSHFFKGFIWAAQVAKMGYR